ncbi:MAG: HlyD family efflux transporter periplasmic adaptor subunit [Candidatus Aminicenantes bacterium]|nr:HlyD family efflux transporter periplasmic adaptor subunit [Candidatus Aminicenantes bacterium]
MAAMEKSDPSASPSEIIEVVPLDSPSENTLVAEHLQRMPNIFARGLIYIIVLVLAVVLAYSLLGKMDVVAECQAVAKPLSDKINILSDRTGYLEQVYVKAGQEVEKDAPLFLIQARESPQRSLEVKRLKLEQNKFSLAAIDSDIAFLQSEIRRLTKDVANTEALQKSGIVSMKDVENARSQLEKARTDAQKLASHREITLNENKILESEMARETEESQKTIRAQKSGIISELYFRNTGVYVRESDLLCTMVPADSPLSVDIKVANKDIGFIEKNMTVKYKFAAFPFQDYGILTGKVTTIPPSAVEDQNLGFVYTVQASLDKTYFEIKGKRYPIKAGMTAQAEVVTQRKSIFALLFKSAKNL